MTNKCPECGKPVTDRNRVERQVPRSLRMADTAARREVTVMWHAECRAGAEAEVERWRDEAEAQRQSDIAEMLAELKGAYRG